MEQEENEDRNSEGSHLEREDGSEFENSEELNISEFDDADISIEEGRDNSDGYVDEEGRVINEQDDAHEWEDIEPNYN